MHATDLGDHIGMESCVDLEIDSAAPVANSAPVDRKPCGVTSRRSLLSGRKLGKELPPPMPIQTSTVMKRYYTDDGRLVITEEKVESPKYVFTANRSHGRLTLQLVPSDSICKSSSSENREGLIDVNSEGIDEFSVVNKVAIGGGGDVDGGNRGGGGKCCGYSTAVRVAAAATGSCLFVDRNRQFQAIRPVQI